MMSLLTELCPLMNGEATNIPALTGLEKSVFHPCFICHQVVKARINKGFLDALNGHCQWNCQPRGE